MGELGDKFREHLTPEGMRELWGKRKEWGRIVGEVKRGILGKEMRIGDLGRITLETEEMRDLAEERGKEMVGPISVELGEGWLGVVAMVPLPKGNQVSLLIPEQARNAERSTFAKVAAYNINNLPWGSWVVRGPTSSSGGTRRAFFNNGAVIFGEGGEVRETEKDLAPMKGAVAVGFDDKEGRRGRLKLLSPAEVVAAVSQGRREEYGNGGVMVGVSTYFEVRPGERERTEKTVIDIMARNGYDATSNTILGFFMEVGEEMFYGNSWVVVNETKEEWVREYYRRGGREELPMDTDKKGAGEIYFSKKMKMMAMVQSVWALAAIKAEESGMRTRVAFMEEQGSAKLMKEDSLTNLLPDWVM